MTDTVQQGEVALLQRIEVVDQFRGRGLFEQFDQLPVACPRQHADRQMAERPLETGGAAA